MRALSIITPCKIEVHFRMYCFSFFFAQALQIQKIWPLFTKRPKLKRPPPPQGVTSNSYCCSLEHVSQRCGAPRPYGSSQYHRRETLQKNWRLFTRGPQLKPPPKQACSAGLTVAVSNPPCSDTVPQALRV